MGGCPRWRCMFFHWSYKTLPLWYASAALDQSELRVMSSGPIRAKCDELWTNQSRVCVELSVVLNVSCTFADSISPLTPADLSFLVCLV